MLARARQRRRWPASFAFLEENLDHVLDREANGFDRIASVNVMWTLPDPSGTIARMAAGLRSGGRMVHTTPRLTFRAYVIVWRHLRRQQGWALARALLGLPVLLFAGFLNLLLVAQSVLGARAPRARQRWSETGLTGLLRDARLEPLPALPCYADQGFLLAAEKRNK
jgi:SAM-dependent methyltransferase